MPFCSGTRGLRAAVLPRLGGFGPIKKCSGAAAKGCRGLPLACGYRLSHWAIFHPIKIWPSRWVKRFKMRYPSLFFLPAIFPRVYLMSLAVKGGSF